MNILYRKKKKIANLNQISFYNPSFLYGINCFEGIRGYWSKKDEKLILFDLVEHLKRLYLSASYLQFNIPIVEQDLINELNWIIKKNIIRENIYIRITFYISEDTNWADCNNIDYLISIRSIESNLSNPKNINLYISNFHRITSNSMPPFIKAGANYLNSRYALLDANRNGFDGALFKTIDEYVSESTGSCVFFIKNGIVYTPDINSDILISITRNRVISLLKKSKIKVIEKRISIKSISSFESAFLVGTMIEICSISKINNINFNINNKIIKSISKKLYNYVTI
jgi:branched-chain amino acid aminotransferase